MSTLTLLVADNSTSGYFGVTLTMSMKSGLPRPYQARVTCAGKQVGLRYFATAEEAALCVARSPEGQVAALALAAAAGVRVAAVAAAAAERSVEERAVAMHRAAERALAALGKGKKRCR